MSLVHDTTSPAVPRAATPKPFLICFSHLRWSFVWQRPQHLMSRAARDYRVIFFEDGPIHAELDGPPRLELTQGPGAVTVAVPVLPKGLSRSEELAAKRALLDGLLEPAEGWPIVTWYYTPEALAYSDHLEPELTVYDCMDELTGFRGAAKGLRRLERKLFSMADVVFTGGASLYEAKRDKHRNVHCFPSSIDKAHFSTARVPGQRDPADQADIPHPRIGFFGVIDERMDMELVARLADLRLDWQLVMLGPTVKIHESERAQRPNIHWLGSKKYEELPAYLAGWDLGFMPFALNEATRFISPTKTPEFLSAGLPVVSTPVRDVVRGWGDQGLVEIAATAEEVVAKAQRLLTEPQDGWLARVDKQLATMSWDRTWREMHGLMERAVWTRPPASSRTAERTGALTSTAGEAVGV